MGDKILVPIDGSEPSSNALEFAIEKFPDSEITVIHVLTPADTGGEIYHLPQSEDELRDEGEAVVEEAVALAANKGVEIDTEIKLGKPDRHITKYAEENGFDQIIMGSHGRSGISRILIGSVAERVVRRSPVAVTIVR